MIKKIVIILFTTFALTINVNASSDGDLLLKKNEPSEIKDCFEGLNRATFAFNQALDGIIFKPVASVYKKLPKPIKGGVSNSLENLSNLVTIPNNLLQGDFTKAGANTGRFVINTTLGIFGLFDVAQYFGLTRNEKEDYGQSLAKLGVGPGCYVVLPVLGPSTARDTISSIANFTGGDPWYNVTVKNNYDSLDNLKNNSIDFYASVKSLYLQDRQQKILNSTQIIDTQDDSDWEEIDNQ